MIDREHPLSRFRREVIDAWTVHVALSAGIFELFRAPSSIIDAAQAAGYDASALEPLVIALARCGHLAEIEHQRFATSDASRRYFLRDSAEYVGNALSFLRTTPVYERYPEVLRTGKGVGLSNEQWSYVTKASASYARPGIETLARECGDFLSRDPLHVLDVGCGQGVYLLELARRAPGLIGLGIDPNERVVEDARQNLSEHPRLRVERGLLSDVTDRFDAIMINQIFHVVGRAESRSLLVAARERLRPGGHVLVQEIVSGGPDPSPELFGVNMRLLFDDGIVLSNSELVSMVSTAGFSEVRSIEIPGPTSGLVYVVGIRQ